MKALSPLPLLFVLAFTALLSHGELPATLKPHAEKYDRDRTVITAAAEAILKPARDRYLAALTAAQQTARAAAKTGDLAAIDAEISGVNAGAVPPNIPPDLPRGLAAERRNFVAATVTTQKTTSPRQRELALAYLQLLATLDAQALKAKDTALTEAIDAENQRVLPHMEAAGGGQKNRNVVENGDFAKGQPGDWPPGWKPFVDWRKADDLALMREGAEQFIRFRRLQASEHANISPEKVVTIPAHTRAAEYSVRIRVKGLAPGKKWGNYPAMQLSARDAADKELSENHAEVKQDGGWKKISGRCLVPENAKTLKIALGPFGAAGVIDFDDVVVELK